MHTDSLYALREEGRIVELGRGLYRLADIGEAEHPDLAVVAARAELWDIFRASNGPTDVPSSRDNQIGK
jgi:hypothetical protein